jgi:hypothetical protein
MPDTSSQRQGRFDGDHDDVDTARYATDSAYRYGVRTAFIDPADADRRYGYYPAAQPTRRPDLPATIARRVDAFRNLIQAAADYEHRTIQITTFNQVRSDALAVLGDHWLRTAEGELETLGWDAATLNRLGSSWVGVADLLARVDHTVAERQNRRLAAVAARLIRE